MTKGQTELTARPIGLLRSVLSTRATMTATLRSLGSGEALAGQPVTFALGAQSCSGTTDSSGTASCGVPVSVAILTPAGYTATYAGSTDSAPSSATARITLL